jgi:MFS family permease
MFVPPFFVPLYASSLGLSSATGAGLVAGFSFASGVGRIISGWLGDLIGPLNSLFMSLLLSGVSMMALWPLSTNLASMAAFVIINGLANGGFFSIMPTVVGNVFGSARVAVAMGMILTSWSGGYLLVSLLLPTHDCFCLWSFFYGDDTDSPRAHLSRVICSMRTGAKRRGSRPIGQPCSMLGPWL